MTCITLVLIHTRQLSLLIILMAKNSVCFLFSPVALLLMSMTVVTLEQQKTSICFFRSSVKGSRCFHYYRTAVEMKIAKYLFRILKKGKEQEKKLWQVPHRLYPKLQILPI